MHVYEFIGQKSLIMVLVVIVCAIILVLLLCFKNLRSRRHYDYTLIGRIEDNVDNRLTAERNNRRYSRPKNKKVKRTANMDRDQTDSNVNQNVSDSIDGNGRRGEESSYAFVENEKEDNIEHLVNARNQVPKELLSIEVWINLYNGILEERFLIPANIDAIEKKLTDYKKLKNDIVDHKAAISILLKKHPNFSTLSHFIAFETTWTNVQYEITKRLEKLQNCKDQYKEYIKALNQFKLWLDENEKKFDSSKRELESLEMFRNDVWKATGDYENVRQLGDNFLSDCDIEKITVSKNIFDIADRWNQLNNEIKYRTEAYERQYEQITAFELNCTSCAQRLKAIERKLKLFDPHAEWDSVKEKDFNLLKNEISQLSVLLESTKLQVNKIISEAAESGVDIQNLGYKIDQLSISFNDLLTQCNSTESIYNTFRKFREDSRLLENSIKNLEEELNKESHTDRQINNMEEEVDRINKFVEKLRTTHTNAKNLIATGEQLIQTGVECNVGYFLEKNVDCKKHLNKMKHTASRIKRDYEKSLNKLKDFNSVYAKVTKEIENVQNQLQMLDKDFKNNEEQLNQLKLIEINEINPLTKSVEGCKKIGMKIIQTSNYSDPTYISHQEMTQMETTLQEVNENIRSKKRSLQIAMVKTPEFKQTLNGLSKWLTDIEDLLEKQNEKLPTSNYEDIKLQFEEQKLLQKMIKDRHNVSKSILELNIDYPEDAEDIVENVQLVKSKFKIILEQTSLLYANLKEALTSSTDLDHKFGNFDKFLKDSELKLQLLMEVMPLDDEEIQEKIQKQKELHIKILSKETDLKELQDLSTKIIALVYKSDASVPNPKIQTATNKYETLIRYSNDSEFILKTFFDKLHQLNFNKNDISVWMMNTQDKLSQLSILSVQKDKLLEEMTVLLQLSNEIEEKQAILDNIMDSSIEFMHQISAEAATEMKNELNLLENQFNELTLKSTYIQKNTDIALPLLEQFYSSNDEFFELLQSSESSIQKLYLNEENLSKIEKDIAKMKLLVAKCTAVGSQICKTVCFDKNITAMNFSIDEMNSQLNAISEKFEEVTVELQKNREATSSLDQLLIWFEEVENKLSGQKFSIDTSNVSNELQTYKKLESDLTLKNCLANEILLQTTYPTLKTNNIILKKNKLSQLMELVESQTKTKLLYLEAISEQATKFNNLRTDLEDWLTKDVNQILLPTTDLIYQQNYNKELLTILNNKFFELDKLKEIGDQLISSSNDFSDEIQQRIETASEKYKNLQVNLELFVHNIEEILNKSEMLEEISEDLFNINDQIAKTSFVPTYPEKIKEHILENENLKRKCQELITKYNDIELSVQNITSKLEDNKLFITQEIQKKMENVKEQCRAIHDQLENRGKLLGDSNSFANEFWKLLKTIENKVTDLKASVATCEDAHDLKVEIQIASREIDRLKCISDDFINCGVNDKELKVEVQKLEYALHEVTTCCNEREEELRVTKKHLEVYQDTLQNAIQLLEKSRKYNLELTSSDHNLGSRINKLNSIKSELEFQLKLLHKNFELLNQNQKEVIKEQFLTINNEYNVLLNTLNESRDKLMCTVSELEEFEKMLNEFAAWIVHKHQCLDEIVVAKGDLEILEIEFTKLKILENNINSRQTTVDEINKMGKSFAESDLLHSQEKIDQINLQWRSINSKATEKHLEFEDILNEATHLCTEIRELINYLKEIDELVSSNKSIGGLPKIIVEQIQRFSKITDDLHNKKIKYETIIEQAQNFCAESKDRATHLEDNLQTLQQIWTTVECNIFDKTKILEKTLGNAVDFQESLTTMTIWLDNIETTLANLIPVSKIFDNIQNQIDDCRKIEMEKDVYQKVMENLDEKLMNFQFVCQRTDIIQLKQSLSDIQSRWETVLSLIAERKRKLDSNFQSVERFYSNYIYIKSWLNKQEQLYFEDFNWPQINNFEKIEDMLQKFQDLKTDFFAKEDIFNDTIKLQEKIVEDASSEEQDVYRKIVEELKTKWVFIHNKCFENLKDVQEAHVKFSQYNNGIKELLPWLKNVEQKLLDNDINYTDTSLIVDMLVEQKQLEVDLSERSGQMKLITEAGESVTKKLSYTEATKIREKLEQLKEIWNSVENLSSSKLNQLKEAHQEIISLEALVQELNDWFDESYDFLNSINHIPGTNQSVKYIFQSLKEFKEMYFTKELRKNRAMELANSILSKSDTSSKICFFNESIKQIENDWENISELLNTHYNSISKEIELVEDIEKHVKWLSDLEESSSMQQELPTTIFDAEKLVSKHNEIFTALVNRIEELQVLFTENAIPTETRTYRYSFTLNTIEFREPKVKLLYNKCDETVKKLTEEGNRLEDHVADLREKERLKNFKWDDWRQRFLQFTKDRKFRIVDFFKSMQTNNNPLMTRDIFINGILRTGFETSRLEMELVVNMLTKTKNELFDWKEFVAALKEDWNKNVEDLDIEGKIKSLQLVCTCAPKYKVIKVDHNKYRFGESQKQCLVRKMRNTVMVRIGGGWESIDTFFSKNDPCKCSSGTISKRWQSMESVGQYNVNSRLSRSMTTLKMRKNNSRSNNNLAMTGSTSKNISRKSRLGIWASTSILASPIKEDEYPKTFLTKNDSTLTNDQKTPSVGSVISDKKKINYRSCAASGSSTPQFNKNLRKFRSEPNLSR